MASSDRVLYWGSGSTPCWRVQIALAEKDLPYESKLMQFSKSAPCPALVMAGHMQCAVDPSLRTTSLP